MFWVWYWFHITHNTRPCGMAVASSSVSVGPALRSGCSEWSLVRMKSIISLIIMQLHWRSDCLVVSHARWRVICGRTERALDSLLLHGASVAAKVIKISPLGWRLLLKYQLRCFPKYFCFYYNYYWAVAHALCYKVMRVLNVTIFKPLTKISKISNRN